MITSKIFQVSHRGSCHFVGEVIDGYVKHKRNDLTCDPCDSQGNEKCSFISIVFNINILIRNENITSEEHKRKNRLK